MNKVSNMYTQISYAYTNKKNALIELFTFSLLYQSVLIIRGSFNIYFCNFMPMNLSTPYSTLIKKNIILPTFV